MAWPHFRFIHVDAYARSALRAAAVAATVVVRSAAAQIAPAPVVTASFAADHYLAARTPIILTMRPATIDGTVAIILGTTDVTALFDRRGDQLVYRADVLPLPSGESDVTVYVVNGAAWTEVARFP